MAALCPSASRHRCPRRVELDGCCRRGLHGPLINHKTSASLYGCQVLSKVNPFRSQLQRAISSPLANFSVSLPFFLSFFLCVCLSLCVSVSVSLSLFELQQVGTDGCREWYFAFLCLYVCLSLSARASTSRDGWVRRAVFCQAGQRLIPSLLSHPI